MRFVPNVAFETVNAVVEVDAGMAVGSYRFQLVVQGESGLKSDPAEMTVLVTGTELPPLFDERRPVSLGAVNLARPVAIRSAPKTPSAKRQSAKAKPAKRKPAKRKPAKRKPAKPASARRKPAKSQGKPRTPPK